MANVQLTPKQYAKNGTVNCPVCGSLFLTYGRYQLEDDTTVSQYASCSSCKANWYDEFKLVGYTDLAFAPDREATNG